MMNCLSYILSAINFFILFPYLKKKIILGFSLSPSPSASSAIPPIEEGIPSSVSHGKAFRSNAPAPAFELNGLTAILGYQIF